MKIEKVNDHQIRCTLTKKELEKRDLKLSEIAYGNEKVKTLFRDMMRMAAHQYGFEAEDIPLMIEVIPFAECAVIVVTKVEDPDELDTRFSKFAPSLHKDNNTTLSSALEEVFGNLNKSDNLLDILKKIQGAPIPEPDDEDEDSLPFADEYEEEVPAIAEHSEVSPKVTATGNTHEVFYTFSSLNALIKVARVLAPHYRAVSRLYKDTGKDVYLLFLSQGTHSDAQFRSFCHLIEEFATRTPGNEYLKFFVDEHCTPMLSEEALQQLASF